MRYFQRWRFVLGPTNEDSVYLPAEILARHDDTSEFELKYCDGNVYVNGFIHVNKNALFVLNVNTQERLNLGPFSVMEFEIHDCISTSGCNAVQ